MSYSFAEGRAGNEHPHDGLLQSVLKLAYHVNGLVPTPSDGSHASVELLNSYELERRKIAQELIEFDHKFSSIFSGQIGTEGEEKGLTHEQFLEVFSTGNGFTSGCGIE